MEKLIAGCVTVITLIILATFWMQVQTGAVVAEMAQEIRLLKQDQLTDRARIKALADEQDWLAQKVKIHKGDYKR